jgi:hypothetical protein
VAFAGGGNKNNANHRAYFIVHRLDDHETPDELTARVSRVIAVLHERHEGVDFTSHTASQIYAAPMMVTAARLVEEAEVRLDLRRSYAGAQRVQMVQPIVAPVVAPTVAPVREHAWHLPWHLPQCSSGSSPVVGGCRARTSWWTP